MAIMSGIGLPYLRQPSIDQTAVCKDGLPEIERAILGIESVPPSLIKVIFTVRGGKIPLIELLNRRFGKDGKTLVVSEIVL